MKEKVEEAIREIRPMLQADGGDVELVDVEDGVAKVRLKGACMGCPMATWTLQEGIRRILLQKVPGLKDVIAV